MTVGAAVRRATAVSTPKEKRHTYERLQPHSAGSMQSPGWASALLLQFSGRAKTTWAGTCVTTIR